MGGNWRGLAVSQHAFRATNSEIEAKLVAEAQRLHLIRHGYYIRALTAGRGLPLSRTPRASLCPGLPPCQPRRRLGPPPQARGLSWLTGCPDRE